MLQAWLSIGYIVLLAILVLAFILWRSGGDFVVRRSNEIQLNIRLLRIAA